MPATNSYFYADLAIICGTFVYGSDDDNAVANPRVLVEVLSDSTEDYDRGTKFQHYRRLKSLRWYVLVSQFERRIEVRQRVQEGWLIREITDGTLALDDPKIEVPFDDIYDLAGVCPPA